MRRTLAQPLARFLDQGNGFVFGSSDQFYHVDRATRLHLNVKMFRERGRLPHDPRHHARRARVGEKLSSCLMWDQSQGRGAQPPGKFGPFFAANIFRHRGIQFGLNQAANNILGPRGGPARRFTDLGVILHRKTCGAVGLYRGGDKTYGAQYRIRAEGIRQLLVLLDTILNREGGAHIHVTDGANGRRRVVSLHGQDQDIRLGQ